MKVFGIGQHKTGTTTLLECLRILSLDICPKVKSYAIREVTATYDFVPCLHLASQHAAFADSPWNYLNTYRVLDVAFPGSFFVLTTRDEYKWFESLSRWVIRNGSSEWIDMISTLGASFDINNERRMTNAFRYHNEEVISYFSSDLCLGRLLVVNWETGDRWERLCRFLDIEPPYDGFGFPHMEKYDEETNSYVNSSPG